jgi:hypothetical protein
MTEQAIDIADSPPMIVSRFGNQSVECPMWLLEQLQRERHSIDVDAARLITEAEQIKQATTL